MRMMEAMRYSFGLGLRNLLKQPRTMVVAILTLALGLAATMTMLTLLSMLASDPLPGLSQNLYLGWVDSRAMDKVGNDVRDATAVPPRLLKLSDVEAIVATHPGVRQSALVPTSLDVESADGTRQDSVRAVLATGPMPSMFGVPLLHGRYWTAAEERDHLPVVVVSRDTSLKMLGIADGTGHRLRIGHAVFQVIGISAGWAPQPHVYALQEGEPAWGEGFAVDAYLPLRSALDAGVAPLSSQDCDRVGYGGFHFDELDLGACRFLQLWVELRTPQQVETYRAGLLSYAHDRHAIGAFPRQAQARLYGMREWLDANRVVPGNVHLNLWLALALLSLCMVNVTGLLAARFLRRSGEIGVRRVLGAPRSAILLQCMTESGAAGLAGGLLALPLTLFGLWVVRQQDQG